MPDDSERGVQLVDSLRRLFAGLVDEIAHADKDRALDFAFRIIDSVATNSILVDVTSKAFGTVRDEELVEQLVSVVTGYLRTDLPPSR